MTAWRVLAVATAALVLVATPASSGDQAPDTLAASGVPPVALDADRSPGRTGLPAPVYVRWLGAGSSYDDVRVPCCTYSEMADVAVTSPWCARPFEALPDGTCHADVPGPRHLRIAISWSDGEREVVHVRTTRSVFVETMPYRARDVRWDGRPHPQLTVTVHERRPGLGYVHLGTAVRDIRLDPDWPTGAPPTRAGSDRSTEPRGGS